MNNKKITKAPLNPPRRGENSLPFGGGLGRGFSTPKVLNVDNPMQAVGAARGKAPLNPPRRGETPSPSGEGWGGASKRLSNE